MRFVSGVGAWLPVLALCLGACAASRPGLVPAGESGPGPAFPVSEATARTGEPRHVYVTVVDRDGAPMRDARVRLCRVENGSHVNEHPAKSTDALGRVVLEADAPGLHRVSLEEAPGIATGWLRRGAYAHAAQVVVEEGETVGHGVRIVAPRPGSLEIRVHRGTLGPEDRVSVTLRRRYPNGDLLSRHDSNTRPEPFFGGVTGTESWLWDELPEGAYVARVSVPEKRTSRFIAAEVSPAALTTYDVGPGAPGAPLVLSFDGQRDGVRKQLSLNPLDGGPDLVRGSLDAGPYRSFGASPGRYVAILPRVGASMVIDVPEVAVGEQARIRLAPPGWTRRADGGATVTVRVLRDGEHVPGVFFGLAPPAPEHLRSGSWLRTGTSQRIEEVPPGDWDLVVLNGVFAEYAGLPLPIVQRVRVGTDDVVVNVRVSTE